MIRQLELATYLDRVQGPTHDFDAAVMGIPGDLGAGQLARMLALSGLRADGGRERLLRVFSDSTPAVFLYHARGVQGVNRRVQGHADGSPRRAGDAPRLARGCRGDVVPSPPRRCDSILPAAGPTSPPSPPREGGSVVNAAIDLRATAAVTPGGERYRLVSRTSTIGARSPRDRDASDGHLRLHKCALRRGGIGPCRLRSPAPNAPAGSGLGSSGALGVALVRGDRRGSRHPASGLGDGRGSLAGRSGGRAARGRTPGSVRRGPGRIPSLSVSPPKECAPTRSSSTPRSRQVLAERTDRLLHRCVADLVSHDLAGDGWLRGEEIRAITAALRGLAALAGPMADGASRCGPARGRADCCRRTGNSRWRSIPACGPPRWRDWKAAMTRAGSLGGKAAGAGAGGCMFFLCDDPARARRAGRRRGRRPCFPVTWATQGVRAWRA